MTKHVGRIYTKEYKKLVSNGEGIKNERGEIK